MKNFLAVIGGIVVGFFVLMIVVFVSNDLNTPELLMQKQTFVAQL